MILLDEASIVRIEDLLRRMLNCENGPCKEATSYINDKRQAAETRRFVASRLLEKLSSDRPTQELTERAFMGLLRSIDEWVEISNATKLAPKNQRGKFARFAEVRIREHVSAPDWRPTHGGDQHILNALILDAPAGVKTEEIGRNVTRRRRSCRN
ncbi:MAG: hypothetical protein HYV60_10710 [Planctomycetia bacterium]|nr:hypothetical protein [Planctomycetia bacterium]